jgi:uncharacterized protein YjaG (DUF416 family)
VDEFDIIFEEFDLTFRYLYRGIVDQVRQYDTDEAYVKELEAEFNNTLELFQHIIPQDEK